jgi:hypothetical protein
MHKPASTLNGISNRGPAPALSLGGAYGPYTLAAIASLVFVWIAVRETKGKTLEEM